MWRCGGREPPLVAFFYYPRKGWSPTLPAILVVFMLKILTIPFDRVKKGFDEKLLNQPL
jgi:hypothetical protein